METELKLGAFVASPVNFYLGMIIVFVISCHSLPVPSKPTKSGSTATTTIYLSIPIWEVSKIVN